MRLWGLGAPQGPGTGVHRSYKFSLLTLASNVEATRFAFFLIGSEQVGDERRRFTLSPADIALLNPNTHTCPIFRTAPDAELTRRENDTSLRLNRGAVWSLSR